MTCLHILFPAQTDTNRHTTIQLNIIVVWGVYTVVMGTGRRRSYHWKEVPQEHVETAYQVSEVQREVTNTHTHTHTHLTLSLSHTRTVTVM